MASNHSVIALTFLLFLSTIMAGCGKSPSEENQEEMVLYTALVTKIPGLDPGNIAGIYAATVAGQILECLYQYHYLKRPYELIPQLAEDMPEISGDGLTCTIKIKKGVYFTDDPCFEGDKGRELTAEDFIFAWKRIADIKYISKNWWIFDGRIVGLDEFREYTKSCKKASDVDYSRPVEGLQAPDDYTLIIKLKKSWPQIAYLLAHQPTAPVAKEAVDYYGKDIISHPVGTGPFILHKWHRGSYIEMLRNPNFRDQFYPSEGEPQDLENGLLADAGKKLPFVDRIVWTLIEEEQPRWLQFLLGKLDASVIPKDNFAQAIDVSRKLTPQMKQRNIHLKTFRDPDTFWIGFNMEDPLVGKNKPLRKALSYAIDRAKFNRLFWNNRYDLAYGFIPPLMKAYDPKVKDIGISYDPGKAKQLVKQAERVHGGKLPQLRLSMGGTDTLSRQMGQFYERGFENVGLDVEAEYMDWPTFQEKTSTKGVQIFSLGWIADYPDTENFLQLFYSKNISPGSNNFNYTSGEFDKLYEQVIIMPDSPERTELYRKAERLIIEDCPAAFTEHRVRYILHYDWVLNYKPHVFQYGLAKYRRIDLEKRRAYKELLKKIR
jgi:ABC-type transport system substrate-binding protein